MILIKFKLKNKNKIIKKTGVAEPGKDKLAYPT